jgi:hypothetical protein
MKEKARRVAKRIVGHGRKVAGPEEAKAVARDRPYDAAVPRPSKLDGGATKLVWSGREHFATVDARDADFVFLAVKKAEKVPSGEIVIGCGR